MTNTNDNHKKPKIKYAKQPNESNDTYWARRTKESLPYLFGPVDASDWKAAAMAVGTLTWVGFPEYGIPKLSTSVGDRFAFCLKLFANKKIPLTYKLMRDLFNLFAKIQSYEPGNSPDDLRVGDRGDMTHSLKDPITVIQKRSTVRFTKTSLADIESLIPLCIDVPSESFALKDPLACQIIDQLLEFITKSGYVDVELLTQQVASITYAYPALKEIVDFEYSLSQLVIQRLRGFPVTPELDNETIASARTAAHALLGLTFAERHALLAYVCEDGRLAFDAHLDGAFDATVLFPIWLERSGIYALVDEKANARI
jgi:hypothetical protein